MPTEVKEIYGNNMTSIWSGGVVYTYFQGPNDYGKQSNMLSDSSCYLHLTFKLYRLGKCLD